MGIEDKALWLVRPEALDNRDRSRASMRRSQDQSAPRGMRPQETQHPVSFPAAFRVEEQGAILLQIRQGRCYRLSELAASVWKAIEEMPEGITVESIAESLRSQFQAPTESLRRAADACVQELERESLVAKSDDTDPPSLIRSPYQPDTLRVFRFGSRSTTAAIGNPPFVEHLKTFQSLVDQLFPQAGQNGLDWRANKLKRAIDDAPSRAIEILGNVSSQLQLSLSDRQARRLFKEAGGISMKDYARKRRLVAAAIQLQETVEPIKSVATEAGFGTYHGFRKAFCEMFHLTPMEFRKFWQRSPVAASGLFSGGSAADRA